MSDFDNLADPPPVFIAKFNSTCANCGETLREGQQATFDGNEAVHLKCPERRAACPRCFLVHGTHQEECDG